MLPKPKIDDVVFRVYSVDENGLIATPVYAVAQLVGEEAGDRFNIVSTEDLTPAQIRLIKDFVPYLHYAS
jgi:hypothetical protein